MSNFHIYIYKKNIHYNLGKIQKKKEMYRQKSVIFTIGKTLYIENTHFWGKIQKKKEGFFYIYKKTPIISIYIVKTLQSGQGIKEKKGSYIGKIPLYKEKHL